MRKCKPFWCWLGFHEWAYSRFFVLGETSPTILCRLCGEHKS